MAAKRQTSGPKAPSADGWPDPTWRHCKPVCPATRSHSAPPTMKPSSSLEIAPCRPSGRHCLLHMTAKSASPRPDWRDRPVMSSCLTPTLPCPSGPELSGKLCNSCAETLPDFFSAPPHPTLRCVTPNDATSATSPFRANPSRQTAPLQVHSLRQSLDPFLL